MAGRQLYQQQEDSFFGTRENSRLPGYVYRKFPISLLTINTEVWSQKKLEAAKKMIAGGQNVDPIVVAQSGNGRWAIADGIHRTAAAKSAGHLYIGALMSPRDAVAFDREIQMGAFEGEAVPFSRERAFEIGSALGVDWKKISLEQFRVGLGVEMEHADVTGGDPLKTGRIVLAHLKENREYYSKLKRAGLERGREEKGISFLAEGEKEDCHVCRPFTRLVRDNARLEACKRSAEHLGDLGDPRKLYELVREDYLQEDQEVFRVACLDFRGKLRDYAEVARGQRHRVATDIEDIARIVVESARDAGCDGYVVFHNHPSGKAEPSEADGDLTQAIKKASEASLPSVHFLDHLVIGSGEFYSFAANGWSDDGKVTKV